MSHNDEPSIPWTLERIAVALETISERMPDLHVEPKPKLRAGCDCKTCREIMAEMAKHEAARARAVPKKTCSCSGPDEECDRCRKLF